MYAAYRKWKPTYLSSKPHIKLLYSYLEWCNYCAACSFVKSKLDKLTRRKTKCQENNTHSCSSAQRTKEPYKQRPVQKSKTGLRLQIQIRQILNRSPVAFQSRPGLLQSYDSSSLLFLPPVPILPLSACLLFTSLLFQSFIFSFFSIHMLGCIGWHLQTLIAFCFLN